MGFKIAAIADLHYSRCELALCGKRRGAIADILLLRTVHRLNRFIKPDVTLILGDLIDDPSGPGAEEELRHLKGIVDLLESPVIVIPGNHDGDVDKFYSVFDRPGDAFDLGGVRFMSFVDPEEPGYNARRTDADLKRMKDARAGHEGPVVSVQHVPLFKPGTSPSPYGFVNAEEAWSAFVDNGFTLAISGHFHAGDDLVGRSAGPAVIVPALCESPFGFMEIDIEGDRIKTRRHQLKLPLELGLVDYHVHTPFAYCQENMDMPLTVSLAREMGLAGFSFSEHTGQLYFDRKTFWSAEFCKAGIETTTGLVNRMPDYFAKAHELCPPAYLGLEIDCDFSGNPVVRPEDMAMAQVRVGAVHWLAEMMKPEPDINLAGEEMLYRLSRFLGCGIQILAHPFRVFNRSSAGVSSDLMRQVVDLLRKHGVAAEINFHTQTTQPELVKLCIESGVKLALGSDSHNLYEVGEFYPHLELLRECGYTGSELADVLVSADFGVRSAE